MNKILVTSLALTALLLSCSNKSSKCVNVQTNEDKQIVMDSVGVSHEDGNEAAIKDFLTTLYDDYVFEYHDFSLIRNHFSDKVLNRLTKEYDYDGEGYAVWLFRTGAQDGPSDVSRVNDITKEKDGWYTVKYTDMGIEGVCHFLVQSHNGEIIVMDFH